MQRTTNDRWTRTLSQLLVAVFACLALVALVTLNPAAANDPVDDLGDNVEEEIEDNIGHQPPLDPDSCYVLEEIECCQHMYVFVRKHVDCENNSMDWFYDPQDKTYLPDEVEGAPQPNTAWNSSNVLLNTDPETVPQCRYREPYCDEDGWAGLKDWEEDYCTNYYTNGPRNCPEG